MQLREISIDEIALSELGWLTVRPALPDGEDFSLIYRTATGVRWWPGLRSLGPDPETTLTPAEWFARIIDAARSEYGCDLVLTSQTKWVNVTPDVERSLRAARAPMPN